MVSEHTTREGTPSQPRAVRLTFAFEGNEIHLVNQQSLETIPPPTDPLSGFEGGQGFWVEIRNQQGELLHRQVRPNPLRQDVEVFSPDPSQSVARAPAERHSGIFTVLVPDFHEADHVALMSSTAPGATPDVPLERAATSLASGAPASELARFSLRPDSSGGGS